VSDIFEFVGLFREPLSQIGLDSLREQGLGCGHSGRCPRY
jgi:hypothetical protein